MGQTADWRESGNLGGGIAVLDLKRRAVRGVSWSAVEMIGRQIVALVVFVVLARILGPDTFGLFAMALVVVGLAEQTVADGLAQGLVQRESIEEGHVDAAFWGVLGFSAVLSVIAVALAPALARAFGEPSVEVAIYWLTPIILLTALATIPSVILQREFAFRALAVRTTAGVVIGGAVGLAMAVQGYGIWSLVGHQLAMRVAALAVVWWSVPWRPGLRGKRRHFQDLWAFAVNMLILRSLSIVHQRLVTFLIGVHLGADAVGFFNLATRCYDMLMAVFVTPATRVAFPLFSRLMTEPERMRRAFATLVRLVSLIAFPVFAGAALVGPELVPIVFGAEWTPAVWIFVLYVAGGVLSASMVVGDAAVRSAGKVHWLTAEAACWAIATLIAITAVASYGILWPVVVIVAGTVLTIPVNLAFVRRIVGITPREFIGLVAPAAAGIGVMAIVVTLFRMMTSVASEGAIGLAASVAVGALTYALWQAAFNRAELMRLRDHFRSLRQSPEGADRD